MLLWFKMQISCILIVFNSTIKFYVKFYIHVGRVLGIAISEWFVKPESGLCSNMPFDTVKSPAVWKLAQYGEGYFL